jgi:alkyl hydroperoxide reductase subunit AhpC
LTAVAVKYPELQKMDVEVLSLSTDSRFAHKIWQAEELEKMVKGGVPYPMLSDAGGRIGRVYGVYDEGSGVDLRGRFIIDPDGVIQAMEVLTPSVGRNVAELIRQVQAFQLVRKTGLATPSGWQPGKSTLTPSPALVGAVWKIWKPEMAFGEPQKQPAK